ncbi:MAG: sensor histidine kinase, partial [Rhizobiaceae bacterium]
MIAAPVMAADHLEQPVVFRLLSGSPVEATVNDICCGEFANSFAQDQITRFEIYQGEPIRWLKLSSLPGGGVLDFGLFVDDVTLFTVDSSTGHVLRTSKTGDQVAARERNLVATHNAFLISGSDLKHELFVRIHHANTMVIEPRFVSGNVFWEREHDAMPVHALLIGAIAIMILYNFLVGVFNRQSLFVFFAISLLAMLINNFYFTGLGPAYIWTDTGELSNLIREICMIAGVVFTGLTFYTFLKGPKPDPLPVKLVLVFALAILPVSTSIPVFPPWIARLILGIVAAISVAAFLLISAILAWRGHDRAKLLLPALLLVSLPVMAIIVIPKDVPAFQTMEILPGLFLAPNDHFIEVVMLIDALLFSLLFSYRLRLAEQSAIASASELTRVQKGISERLLQSIDSERRRIASDLHDTAGQGMVLVANRLKRIASTEFDLDTSRRDIADVETLATDVLTDIRRVSHDLHPAALDHLGLPLALRQLVGNAERASGLDIVLEVNLAGSSFSKDQTLQIYRIVQELITNVVTHARASSAKVAITAGNPYCVVEVSDDGRGIRSHDDASNDGIGADILLQRVEMLNGEIDIASGDRGTR